MGAGASKKKDKEPKTPSRLAPTGGQNRSRSSSLTPSTGTNAARPRSRSRSPGINHAKLETKDLMISYSHADKEFMNKLKDNLELNGITVWVDVIGLTAGVDFLQKIGQAILDAKLFITLLSSNSVKSKYCQDEVALAYISQKALFPVAIESRETIQEHMDTGMKLQTASIEWSMFVDSDNFTGDFQKLLSKLKLELKDQGEEKNSKKRLKKQQNSFSNSLKQEKPDKHLVENPYKYWSDLYKDAEMIPWQRFITDFTRIFQSKMDALFTGEDKEWLMANLYSEMEDEDEEDEMLLKENFINFCKVDEEIQPLWLRVEDHTRELYAMREVFDMDSSVRLEAIQNLGKFQSTTVINALRDLLRSTSSNVRAVAAVSLVKTGDKDPSTVDNLMKCLNDKDRLVREAGCLALGQLHAKKAVPKLLHLWRNDFISHVREAAQASLEQIGGKEVEEAMHITKVLAEEIRMLTAE
ncbi:Hypothetical predicted protein [Mytilus galloprovincialis]|uniref:TIR domain-containing protein n=1 Tax=Mytilus galloprovincialis TaxID=29158 RepID=A0A8B6F1L8_MYTGA|nr:Hypothetical predicted protein [Mytilus galloprovincialis]